MDQFSFFGMFKSSVSNNATFRKQFYGNTLDEDHKYRLISILDIDESISSIPDGFFCGCSNLREIQLPLSITRIGRRAFADCPKLYRVDLPSCLKELDDGSFDGCSSLADVLVDGTYDDFPGNVTYIGKAAFRNTAIEAISLGCNNYILGDYAFSGCKSLTSVGLYNNVSAVGEYAFDGCTALVDLDVSDSVSFLPATAFHNCNSLNSENIPAIRIPADFPDPGALTYSSIDGRLRPNLSDSIACSLSMAPFLDFLDNLKLCLKFPHYYFHTTMDYFRLEAWNGVCKVYSWKEISGTDFDYIRTQDLYDVLTKQGKA